MTAQSELDLAFEQIGVSIKADRDRLTSLEGKLPVRLTGTYTTASIAKNATSQGLISLSKSYRLLKIETDRAARVRLYATASQRTADLARVVGVDPTGNHGLIFEFVTGSVLSFILSPFVDGSNMETVPSSNIPISVTNLSDPTATVTVTLTYIATE